MVQISRVDYERLFESETLFRQMADSTPVLIWISGVDALRTWFNQPWLEFRGRTFEQELGNGWAEGVPHDDFEEARKIFTSHSESRTPFRMEYRLRRADGEYRWLLDQGTPRVSDSGVFLGFIGSCIDITDIRVARELQRELSKRLGELAAIVDSSDDVILSKDLNGIITSWNAAAVQVFGYSPEEIIGTSVLRLIPEALRSEEETILANVRAGRRVEHFETQRVTKSGELIDVSLTISPIKDSSGEVVGASKILRDISGRKRMEETQQTMSKRLAEAAAIVESSDDAILSKDLNGIITSWNVGASRIFGYTAEEMIGASILKLIPVELHSDEATIIGKVRAGERIEHFETVRLAKDGRRLTVSLTVSPIKDEQGRVIGASKILRDISDRKRIEESLLQSEKIAAAGRMAATIAHEVNNPLEAVTNLLYLLRPLITDLTGLDYLATAESEIARVSHIAKQTLGFYREHAAASPASVAEIVQHAISIYEPRCIAAGIEVKKSFGSMQKVVLRRGEMMQVVSNLIANSIYAMRRGGTLSISVQDADPAEDGIVVVLEDSGVGIAAEDMPKVFDAFFTTRSTIGTGIGLFVAKQFVEGHGGRIMLESKQGVRDHGTTIRIFLPLRTAYDVSPES
jgi:PAS domain S-box-containing protein